MTCEDSWYRKFYIYEYVYIVPIQILIEKQILSISVSNKYVIPLLLLILMYRHEARHDLWSVKIHFN